MAERSGFFDSHLVGGEYDRVYLADSFARYFASFIGNGVFGGKSDELMIFQETSAVMGVKALSGQGWINGYWYENTTEVSLPIEVADGTLNRIDTVVLRLGSVERSISIAVKKGTPAVNAVPPTLQRDSDYYELKLAEVSVKAGATSIQQVDITDTRLDTTVCGLVVGVVQQFDTTEFGVQLNSFIESYIGQSKEDYNKYVSNLTELSANATAAYDALVANIEGLKKSGQQEANAYLEWLASQKQLASDELRIMLDELQGIIDTSFQAGVDQALAQAKETGDFDGATFTPHLSEEGLLSWENDKGLENPPPVSVKGEKGDEGVGISSIEQTETSTEDDGNNVFTVTLTNGTVVAFTVQNGSKGEKGVSASGETVTVEATSWTGEEAPYIATVASELATADNHLIVGAGGFVTAEQQEAMATAMLICTGQANGSITLSAFGDKPTIDLPVNIICVG